LFTLELVTANPFMHKNLHILTV